MACPFFRDFSFLEISTYLSNIPHPFLRVGEYFFAPPKKFYKIPYKHLTYARVSYIIISLLGLFLLNFSFILNKPFKGLAKQSKKFTITKLLDKKTPIGRRL